jgi:hypothetical protein
MYTLSNILPIIPILILLGLFLQLEFISKVSGQGFSTLPEREIRPTCDLLCEFETFLSKPIGNISISILGGIISAAVFALILTFWQKPKLRFEGDLNLVNWNDNATARELRSAEEILIAQNNGELEIARTNILINSPAIQLRQ